MCIRDSNSLDFELSLDFCQAHSQEVGISNLALDQNLCCNTHVESTSGDLKGLGIQNVHES